MRLEHTTTHKTDDVNLARTFWAASREMIARGGSITFRTFDTALLRAGLAVGLAVLATGCQQQYWYQEGKTFAECKADHEDCWNELLRRTDLRFASSYRRRFLEDCMQQRGYEPVADRDLPLDVKREDPDVPSDVPWIHSYGVAGTISTRPRCIPPDCATEESATLARR